MQEQKSHQKYYYLLTTQKHYCLLIRDNSHNKCSQKYLTRKPKIRFNKLSRIGIAIIITLLTSLTPVNEETLDTQNQTIQIIKNYATITRLIWQIYAK